MLAFVQQLVENLQELPSSSGVLLVIGAAALGGPINWAVRQIGNYRNIRVKHLHITDIEGRYLLDYLKKHGISDLKELERRLHNGELVLNLGGDNLDKGKYGVRNLQLISCLKRKYPTRVFSSIGNRDINKDRIGSEVNAAKIRELWTKLQERENASLTGHNALREECVWVDTGKMSFFNWMEANHSNEIDSLINGNGDDSKLECLYLQWLCSQSMGAPQGYDNLRVEFTEMNPLKENTDDNFMAWVREVFVHSDGHFKDFLKMSQVGNNLTGIPIGKLGVLMVHGQPVESEYNKLLQAAFDSMKSGSSTSGQIRLLEVDSLPGGKAIHTQAARFSNLDVLLENCFLLSGHQPFSDNEDKHIGRGFGVKVNKHGNVIVVLFGDNSHKEASNGAAPGGIELACVNDIYTISIWNGKEKVPYYGRLICNNGKSDFIRCDEKGNLLHLYLSKMVELNGNVWTVAEVDSNDKFTLKSQATKLPFASVECLISLPDLQLLIEKQQPSAIKLLELDEWKKVSTESSQLTPAAFFSRNPATATLVAAAAGIVFVAAGSSINTK